MHGFLRLEYHRPQYDADANWNLRDDFQHPKSFSHGADGTGYVVSLGFYTPVERGKLSWRLVFDYEYWRTDDGLDRTYFADGTVGQTQLNEVKLDSWSASYGIQYNF